MKKLFSVIVAFISAFIFCISASAFDANDYDYSWDSGGSSDWGSSDWGDDDYYYSGSTGSFDDDGSGGGIGIGTIIVIVIILIVVFGKNKSGNNGGGNTPTTGMGGGVRPANGGQGMNVNVPDRTGEIEDIIRENDPNFTADDFTSFAKNVYIDIQNAWCARDLSPVRPVMHTNLYNTTDKQVQSKIQQKVIYHYESIAINTAYLTSFVQDNQYEYLTVYLNARFIDYQTNEETGAIIRGDKNTRWDFRYKMKFMRSVGMQTKDALSDNGNGTGHNCPNCGAPLEISSTGKCAYCDSVVTTGMYSWVLSDFTTVRNDTKDDGIRINNAANAPVASADEYADKYFIYANSNNVVDYNGKYAGYINDDPVNIYSMTGEVVGKRADIAGYLNPLQGLVATNGKIIKDVEQLKASMGADAFIDIISFPPEAELRVIDLIRRACGCGLKEAKELVECGRTISFAGSTADIEKYAAELDAVHAEYKVRKS